MSIDKADQWLSDKVKQITRRVRKNLVMVDYVICGGFIGMVVCRYGCV